MSAQKQNLRIAEHNIPVNIYVERRRNVRASIVKSGVNIRIPFFFSAAETEKTIHRLKDWAFKKIESSTALQNKLYPRSYYSGQKIRVQEQEFTLNLEQANRKSFSGKIKGDTIFISLPEDATAEEQSQFLPRLISNLMSKCFYQRTFNRVEAINQKYFGKKIKRFSLKYTASIWGSCSGRGGITLSSRLLLAPQEALDYVIVHELAHFEHPNHSAAFWNEVARVMPNYQEQEKWLKKNGHLCDF
ncbi:MAG: M48 family metallopeptidase [Chitinophagales bacterium]